MNRYSVIVEAKHYNAILIECETNLYTPFRIIGVDADLNEICIYSQNEICDKRVCWVGEQSYLSLFLECEEKIAGFKAKAIRIEQQIPIGIHEYIVLNESILTAPLIIGERTTDLIVIGLCGCNQQGDICIKDEALFEHCVQHIKQCIQGRPIRLWSCLSVGQADVWFSSVNIRQNLINAILSHLEKYGFDGLDIDWEYPKLNTAWLEFSELLVELKAAFIPRKRLLSCALTPWNCFFTNEAVRSLDYVNAMIYDLFDEVGNHESFQCYVKAIDFFRNEGFSNSAICAGIGFYGRPNDQSAVWKDYTYFYDKLGEQLSPNSNFLEGIWFNGRTMCKDKTAAALLEGIGGLMVWHHAADIAIDNPLSLMRGCNEVIV